MREAFDVLEQAISDCGYWRWWTGTLPESFQVEFGRVQLCQPSPDPSQPPSGVYALRFMSPKRIEFLEFAADAEKNWFHLLHDDKLQSHSNLDPEHFFLGDTARVAPLRQQAVGVHVHHALTELPDTGQVCLAFKAGLGFGLSITAESVRILSHSGEIAWSSVAQRYADWWDYWRKYWKLKDTPNELPYDGTCELCIPAGE